MTKQLKYLVIHCTATPEQRKVTSDDIRKWHLEERGWSRLGYSDMIHLDGTLENLTPFNLNNEVESWELTYGTKGINDVSRHVVYVGGLDSIGDAHDTRTIGQLFTLEIYVKYMILRHPLIEVAGHNQFSDKYCPSFDVPEWLRSIGIRKKNIYDER